MKELVLYHTQCADGTSAAAAYQRSMSAKRVDTFAGEGRIAFFPIDYPNAVNVEAFDKFMTDLGLDSHNYDQITFLDFCPKLEVFKHLTDAGIMILVIDHHKSAIDLFDDHSIAISEMNAAVMYILCTDNKLAGGSLVHILGDELPNIDHYVVNDEMMYKSQYQFPSTGAVSQIITNMPELTIPNTPLPKLYELLRVRDVWDISSPEVKEEADCLVAYIGQNDLKDLNNFVKIMDQDIDFVNQGRLIKSVHQKLIDQLIDQGFKTTVNVDTVGLVNVLIAQCPSNLASNLGESWYSRFPDQPAVAFGLNVHHHYKQVGVSLRSNKHFNCRLVAEELGGGGHDCASGGPLKEIIVFPKKEPGEFKMTDDFVLPMDRVIMGMHDHLITALLKAHRD